MADRDIRVRFVADDADLRRSLGRIRTDTQQAQGRVQGLGQSFRGLRSAFRAAGVAFVAREIIQLGRAAFDLGSSVEETGSKFRTVFGQASDEVDAFIADFGRLVGLTESEGRQVTATAGAIAQGMGFAQDASADFAQEIVRVAGDLASFNDVPIERTSRAVISALTGEREALKLLGVEVKQEAVNRRALVDTGKQHVRQLTDQERATATLAIITEKAGVAMGDAERTADSAARTAVRAARDFRQLKEDLAVVATEGLEPLADAIADLGTKLNENRDEIQGFARDAVEALRAFGIALEASFRQYRAFLQLLEAGATFTSNPSRAFALAADAARDADRAILDAIESWSRLGDEAEQVALDLETAGDSLSGVTTELTGFGASAADATGAMSDVIRGFRETGDAAEDAAGGGGGTGGLDALRQATEDLQAAFAALGPELERQRARIEALPNFEDLTGPPTLAIETPIDTTLVRPFEDLADTLPDVTVELTSIEELILALSEAGVEFGLEIDEADKELREFLSTAADIAQVADFVLDTAQAFGILGDEAGRAAAAIEGAVRGAALGASVGGAPGAVAGGALGALGGLFGGGPSAADRFRQQFQTMIALLRINNERLSDIAQGVLASGVTAEQLAALGSIQLILRGDDFGPLLDSLDDLGLSLLDLRQIADEFGVGLGEFLQVVTTGKGDIDLAIQQFRALQGATDLLTDAQLEAAEAAIEAAATLREATAELNRIAVGEEFGILSPTEIIDIAIAGLGTILPPFFVQQLRGFDLTTPEGIAALREFLTGTIIGSALAGPTGPEGKPQVSAFDLTGPEARAVLGFARDILEAAGILEEGFTSIADIASGRGIGAPRTLDELGLGGPEPLTQISQITEVQANEFISVMRTMSHHTRRSADSGERREQLLALLVAEFGVRGGAASAISQTLADDTSIGAPLVVG